MEKYDAKKFDKHFVNWGRLPGNTPTPRHYLALEALFVFSIVTIAILISDSPQFAIITAITALICYYLYRKWKKELEADMESKNTAKEKKNKTSAR